MWSHGDEVDVKLHATFVTYPWQRQSTVFNRMQDSYGWGSRGFSLGSSKQSASFFEVAELQKMVRWTLPYKKRQTS